MPLWLLRGARVAVGRALASRLSLSPSLPSLPPLSGWRSSLPLPPPTSPTIVRHICFLLTPGKRERKKKGKTEKCGVAAGLGASLSDRPHGAQPGPELGRRPRAGRLDGERELEPQLSPGARAGPPWERRPRRGGEESRKRENELAGAQQNRHSPSSPAASFYRCDN